MLLRIGFLLCLSLLLLPIDSTQPAQINPPVFSFHEMGVKEQSHGSAQFVCTLDGKDVFKCSRLQAEAIANKCGLEVAVLGSNLLVIGILMLASFALKISPIYGGIVGIVFGLGATATIFPEVKKIKCAARKWVEELKEKEVLEKYEQISRSGHSNAC